MIPYLMKPALPEETSLPVQWQQFCKTIGRTALENSKRLEVFFLFQDIFNKAGIQVLPLKGLDLLLRAYPSAAFRPMADFDLLIRQKDIPVIMKNFEARGFYRKPDEGLTYLSKDGTANFDLLWDIWYLRDAQPLWRRAVTRSYQGRSFPTLHPEDALLYMVTYVVAHRGVLSPLLVQDLHFFLESEAPHLDWESCAEQADALKIKLPFRRGLEYAAEKGCGKIPPGLLDRLRPASRKERRLAYLYEKLVTEEGQPPVSYFFTWLSYPGLSGKLKLLREKFLPFKWEADIHWGPSSYPLYLTKVLWRFFYLLFRALWILSKDLIFFFPRCKK